MVIDKYPKFTAGRILKQEMLELLRDYPRDYVNIIYNGYSDGIIAGFSVTVDTLHINISPGIIKFGGKIYILSQTIPVVYSATGEETVVKVSFKQETQNSDYIINEGDVIIAQTPIIVENEIELCRYKLHSGARLRNEYVDFNDFDTEYDTVNIINTPFAAPYESTLSPEITRRFAEEALSCQMNNSLDYAFAVQCATGQIVPRLAIITYTAARLDLVTKNSANADSYRYLGRILSLLKQGKDLSRSKGRLGGRTILVD